MEVNMFDIFYVNLAKKEKGVSEQSGIRPCVIVQNEAGNHYSPTVIVIPLTTEIKKIGLPTHCLIRKTSSNGLNFDSMALAEQITTIDKARLVSKIGSIDNANEQNDIIGIYIANLTGKKTYMPIWEHIVSGIYKIIKEATNWNVAC